MPRNGYTNLTLSSNLYATLQEEANKNTISIPQLLRQLLHKRAMHVADNGTLEQDGHYLVEVSRRGYSTITYACKVYNKPSSVIVEN